MTNYLGAAYQLLAHFWGSMIATMVLTAWGIEALLFWFAWWFGDEVSGVDVDHKRRRY